VPYQLFELVTGKHPPEKINGKMRELWKFMRVVFGKGRVENAESYKWLDAEEVTGGTDGPTDDAVLMLQAHVALKSLNKNQAYLEGVLTKFYQSIWEMYGTPANATGVAWKDVKASLKKNSPVEPTDLKWLTVYVGSFGLKYTDNVSGICAHMYIGSYLRRFHGCGIAEAAKNKR
jgi:hypothetical protein